MNKLTLEKIATSLLKACKDEGLMYKEAAKIFNTEPAYFKMLEREDKRGAIPEKVMDRFHSWVYSGKKLKEYKIPGSYEEAQKQADADMGNRINEELAEILNNSGATIIEPNEEPVIRVKPEALARRKKEIKEKKLKLNLIPASEKPKRKYTRKVKVTRVIDIPYANGSFDFSRFKLGDKIINDSSDIGKEYFQIFGNGGVFRFIHDLTDSFNKRAKEIGAETLTQTNVELRRVLVFEPVKKITKENPPEITQKILADAPVPADKNYAEAAPKEPVKIEWKTTSTCFDIAINELIMEENKSLKSEIKTLAFLLAREYEAAEVLREQNGYLNALVSSKDMIIEGLETSAQRSSLIINEMLQRAIRRKARGFWARVFNRPLK